MNKNLCKSRIPNERRLGPGKTTLYVGVRMVNNKQKKTECKLKKEKSDRKKKKKKNNKLVFVIVLIHIHNIHPRTATWEPKFKNRFYIYVRTRVYIYILFFSRRWSSSSLSGPLKIATFEGMRRRCVFFLFCTTAWLLSRWPPFRPCTYTVECVYPWGPSNGKSVGTR